MGHYIKGETEEPWAISSCLRVSPSTENRSSLMRVSALRLHSRCCALSCMADRVDSSMSVSFSTCWYFPRACIQTEHKNVRRCGTFSTNSSPSGSPEDLVPFQVFPHAQVYSLGEATRTQAHWWWSGQIFKKHGTCSYSRDPQGADSFCLSAEDSFCTFQCDAFMKDLALVPACFMEDTSPKWKWKTTKQHNNHRDDHTATLQTDEVQHFHCQAPNRTFAKWLHSRFHSLSEIYKHTEVNT